MIFNQLKTWRATEGMTLGWGGGGGGKDSSGKPMVTSPFMGALRRLDMHAGRAEWAP